MSSFPLPSPQISDETLCSAAARGDLASEDLLVRRYSRLVRICARPLFLAGGDSEDLIQEGMLGLLSAVREYDPEHGASFRAFAELCIRRRLLSAVKAARGGKHAPLNNSISFEAPLFDGSHLLGLSGGTPTLRDPEELILAREALEERTDRLHGQLSDFESKVLSLYLDGLSYSEIAAKVDRSTKAVDNAVQRVRKKLWRQISSGDFSSG